MKTSTRLWQICVTALVSLTLLAACGGSNPDAESSTTEASSTEADDSAATADDASATDDEPATDDASATAATSDEPIIIGQVADFSGDYSFYDVPVRDGAKFAVDEINAAGGVMGRPLELVAVDGQNDQATTTRETEKLIADGASYLIGTTGDPFLAQASLACGAPLTISTGDGTAPTLVGDAGECAYQIIMSDNLQGAVAADYAIEQGYQNAYVLASSDIDYTKFLPEYFVDAFEQAGGTVSGRGDYTVSAGDFSVQVTEIAALDPQPDVIYTPMFIPDTPVFMRELRQAGVTTPVISADGNDDASILDSGEAVDGFVFTTHAFPADGSKLGDLYAAVEEQTGSTPASVVFGLGYDEVYLLKQTIETAGSTEPDAILKAMGELDTFSGVTGDLVMDQATRRATKSVALIKVEGGALNLIDQKSPSYIPAVGN